MWTYDKALRVIRAYLDIRSDGLVALVEDVTIDLPYSWVFFYNSREYMETGDSRFALVGNAPIIFNRVSGEIRNTGTARPIEDYIREYESTLPAVYVEMKQQFRSTRRTNPNSA